MTLDGATHGASISCPMHWGQDDISGSRDVIGHVTIDSKVAVSYRRSIVTKSLSPAVFEIMATKPIGGHELDLSKSRDVIGHVTIGLGMGHFLLVVLWTQVSIEIFRPKRHVLIDTMLNRHCARAISRDMYPLCKI